MFNLFKKKNMNVYKVNTPYDDDGNLFILWLMPKKLNKMFLDNSSTSLDNKLLLVNYLRLKTDRFKNENLEISEKWEKYVSLDVEKVDWPFWLGSERFKKFSEKEKLWLEFFPVLVNEKRKYLVSWRKVPTFWDYDVDTDNTKMGRRWSIDREFNTVFRSDVIEYYSWKFFCNSYYNYKYIVWDIKEKLTKEWFILKYEKRECTQKKFDKKLVENHLIKSRESEKEILTPYLKNIYQKTDEALEQILIEDWETKLLEKFRKEMKWIWKRDFDRYEKWEMWPLEKITFW